MPLGPEHVQTPGDLRRIAPEIDPRCRLARLTVVTVARVLGEVVRVIGKLKHVKPYEGRKVIAIRLGASQTKPHPLVVIRGDLFGDVVIAEDLKRVGIEGNRSAVARRLG